MDKTIEYYNQNVDMFAQGTSFGRLYGCTGAV